MKVYGISDLNDYMELIRKNGFDTPLAISGPEQSGKSSLANACVIQKKGWDESNVDEFKSFLENNTVFKPSDIYKLKKLDEYDDVSIDEAVRVAWRREWYRPENKWMIKLFRQIGQFKRTYYMNIPKFWSLDEELVGDRIKVWVHLIKKDVKVVNGEIRPTKFHAVIFKKDYHAYQDDPWSIKRARKLLNKGSQHMVDLIPKSVGSVLSQYVKLPSFYGYLQFDPLPDKLWKVYKEFSTKEKLSTDLNVSSNKWELRFASIIYNLQDLGLTQSQLSRLTVINNKPLVTAKWFSFFQDKMFELIEDIDDHPHTQSWGQRRKKVSLVPDPKTDKKILKHVKVL